VALIVITGANRGIGLALAEAARGRGDRVIAAVRRSSKELEAADVEVHAGVDVTDDASVATFAAALKDRTVDVLINNAGIHRSDALGSLDFGRIRDQIEVNALGPVRMTRALLPNLPAGAKVAIVTSRSGSIGDNGSGGNYGYRMSKAAVNMAGSNLALDLKAKGVAVAILHPGMVATDMGSGGAGTIPPALSAERLLARIDALTLATTGKFLHAEGHELPW
jgi:NAD(P)-dependent dehydrogenase (short-subunit alcohol dehydrogenase family)